MIRMFFLLLLVLIPVNFYSNEHIDKLVNLSSVNNPEIRAMEYEIKSKNNEIISSYAIPDPMISFEMMNFPVMEKEMGNPMKEKKIGFLQEIPFPGKMILNAEAKIAERDISKANYEKALTGLKKDSSLIYYMIAMTDKKLEILERQKSQVSVMFNLVRSKYETGRISAQEFIRVKLMESMIDKDILMMKLDRSTTMENLLKMTGVRSLPDDIKFEFDVIPGNIEFNDEAIHNALKIYNYDRRISALNVKKYDRQAAAMLWHLAPDFNFGFNFSMPDDGGAYFSFMVGAMIPLYFFTSQLPKANTDLNMKKMAEYNLAFEDNSLLEKLNSNIEIVKKNLEILNLLKNGSISESQLSVDLSFKEYQTDKISYDMLINGIVSLFNLYMEQEEIKFQILSSLETIKYLTGYKIDFSGKQIN